MSPLFLGKGYREGDFMVEGGHRKEESGEGTFRPPIPTARPGIRPYLRGEYKAVMARYYQLLSGHAMTAPFFKVGQDGQDACWWREKSRQSREHLFIEHTAWTKEIKA